MKIETTLDRMRIMEEASGRNPNLLQTYEVMWNNLKRELCDALHENTGVENE